MIHQFFLGRKKTRSEGEELDVYIDPWQASMFTDWF